MALESGTRKRSLFTIMYDRLMVIKIIDKKMYQRILNGIPLSSCIHSAMKNVHLHEVLRFRKHSNAFTYMILAFLTNKVSYPPTLECLLTFWRNGGAHLIKDYSAAFLLQSIP